MNRTQVTALPLLLALVLPMHLGAQEAAPEPAPPAAASDPYAEISGTRISLRVPQGFSLAAGFPGILAPDSGAFVIASEIPAPVAKVLAGMTKESFEQEGITLLGSERVTVSGIEGSLFRVSESGGEGKMRKWVLLFGTDSSTVMLAASVPESLEEALGKTLEQCLLTAQWDPTKEIDPYAGLGFSLRNSETFEVRGRRPGGVILLRKEAPAQLSPQEPILVVFPSTSAAVAPLAVLAKQTLTDGEQFTDFANFAERSLTVNGLNGYEIIADAKEASMSIPVRILLVAVRTADQDMIIEGVVSPENWDKYLPEFRGLAESFSISGNSAHAGHSGM